LFSDRFSPYFFQLGPILPVTHPLIDGDDEQVDDTYENIFEKLLTQIAEELEEYVIFVDFFSNKLSIFLEFGRKCMWCVRARTRTATMCIQHVRRTFP
jgi:phosphate uptake regulator